MTDTVYQKAKRALARMIRRECENNNDSDDYVPIDHAIDAGEKAEKRAASGHPLKGSICPRSYFKSRCRNSKSQTHSDSQNSNGPCLF